MRLAYDDDDLDELLAARFPGTPEDSDANADAPLEDEDEQEDIISSFRPRRPECEYQEIAPFGSPPISCRAPRVSLRLARYLLYNRLTSSDVHVSLTGYELTRRWKPKFPVERFLSERSCVREGVATIAWTRADLRGL